LGECEKIDPAVLARDAALPRHVSARSAGTACGRYSLRQVRLASDLAKGTTARRRIGAAKYADKEKTFEELKAWVTKIFT
jgi:hypothetical protein